MLNHEEATSIDLTLCSKRNRDVFKFEKMPSSLSLLSEGGNDREKRNEKVAASTDSSPMRPALRKEADELDKLLEKSLSVKESEMVHREDRGAIVDHVTALEHTTKGVGHSTENTDELDDMLEELLS